MSYILNMTMANVNVIKTFFSLAAALLMLCSCHSKSCVIEPSITWVLEKRTIDCMESAFPKLEADELKEDWAKELLIGQTFAKEFDLYRAITSFKRALVLLPPGHFDRKMQIEYSLVESYYLGSKFEDAYEVFEKSSLLDATPDFPAFLQLLVILYDSYFQAGLKDKAARILSIIERGNPEIARKLLQYAPITKADFTRMQKIDDCDLHEFLIQYDRESLSVQKAQFLNAVLPGAGYYYVGQSKSALTSFVINALFTAAAYHFFERGDIAAGIITTSFEMGWYFGGINGAGLEAKEYNTRLYENKAKDYMIQKKIYPILLFETAF